MLIRTLADMEAGGRIVSINRGRSSALRMVNASDGLGFSLSEARGEPGGHALLWYKNHWEANYVRRGTGTLEDLTTGRVWDLEPGMMYCVGPRDRHRLENAGGEGFRIVSIFNPPLRGDESHDADGAYAPGGAPPPEGRERMFVKTRAMAEAAGHAVEGAGGWRAARLATAADRLGFSVSDVRFAEGGEADLHYRHHWEANVVLEGSVEVAEMAGGGTWTLGASDVYCVGPEDRHRLRALSDLHVLSVFNPPLGGGERHDANGALPPTGPVPPGPDA